ncbi:FMN reductase [Kaistia sp. 32K]|uniref:NADPH-dependent FMN reductase n=1 Tax=Kaistia sp. 32K TaxID=2795690 RepID=UPI001914EDC4|nr:NADPH-dependent FMN reductase [Kaistia sp. 32K]BCP55289.1 FMN reductase [Kaistia sp. 32K]
MPLVLTLCGSLRAHSSNRALLDATERVAPDGVAFDHFTTIDRLPHFNPDIEQAGLPPNVADLRRRVGAADAILISCPEYARGIPGSFKNALDWLVGGSEFPDKPIALFNASPRASDAQAQLRLVLTTMSGRVIEDATVTAALLAKGLDAGAIAADPAIRSQLVAGLGRLIAAIDADQTG